jgi:hypothetical protein
MPNLERPAAFNEVMEEWLGIVDSKSVSCEGSRRLSSVEESSATLRRDVVEDKR